MDYRALQAEIQGDADCAPYMHTNEMEKIPGDEAFAKDNAIALIRNSKRAKVPTSRMITERGIREALSIVDGANFLKALRELHDATEAPAWLTDALTAATVPTDAQWAYFDTMRCGWEWLKGDGLDLGASKTRSLLGLIGQGLPALAGACATLAGVAMVDNHITARDVSLAMRGPWGDE